jgi:hypothetical protein
VPPPNVDGVAKAFEETSLMMGIAEVVRGLAYAVVIGEIT